MDPAKSGLPIDSGQIICPQFYNYYISNLSEADTSQLQTTNTDHPQHTLADTKLLPKINSETTLPDIVLYTVWTLVNPVCK